MAQTILTGIPVSVGIAIGKAHLLNHGRFCLISHYKVGDEQKAEEIVRLQSGFDQAQQELEQIRSKIPEELKEHLSIIDSHVMMLRDPKLRSVAEKYIQEQGLNAEKALEQGVDSIETAFSSIEDEYIRTRIQDIRLMAERVQKKLLGSRELVQAVSSKVILVAHDLSPADTVELELDKIMAFTTALGGRTSHVCILARTLQIPAVVGVGELESTLMGNELLIIDGFQGNVLVNPSEEELSYYTDLKHQFEAYQANVNRSCQLPGETVDGYRVQVLANIELFKEVDAVAENGGEGVGLFRTEYSYLNRFELPDEEELYTSYRDLASILAPDRVIIRTLDIGGDKFTRGFEPLEENNPALGLRAIRFCLQHKQMFKTQLRAILRASESGNLSIMFPMVSGTRELRELKEMVEETKAALSREGLPFNPDISIGIMIELPSAVMTADILAQEADFFSIGTNDLIQYSLGIDRTNKHVSYLYQPLHPALLRSIKHVVDAGHQAGIEVSVCGEMASDPYCVPVLMGMRVDCLSLNPQSIPGIKHILRQTTMDECTTLLKQVLESPSVTQNNNLVREKIYNRFPEELMFYTSMLDGA